MKSHQFVWLLGVGFMFSAIVAFVFNIHSGIILGLSIFAFCITVSDFLGIEVKEEKELSPQNSKGVSFFRFVQSSIIAIAVPLSFIIPLVIIELFVNADEVISRLASYIAIFSLGLSLMIRKKICRG
ncbi:hypothetical protein JMM81_12440 [Bacillus sp. V3B]|uniref:hypothetical protein n=1 Tax=Bacillus sp. V3B TaxID=2804915 RepID=UPI0021097726|nr:hypothetical protein [Bacillus sp. V3B]MCQ6275764.1 hypothetical protein [Bacillus sp. V3B]